MGEAQTPTQVSNRAVLMLPEKFGLFLPTYDKCLLGLGAVLVVPGRPARRVDGSLAGPQQGRLRLALARGALSGRFGGPHGRVQAVQGLGAAVAGDGNKEQGLNKNRELW